MDGALFLFALLGAASSLLSISESIQSRRALAVLLTNQPKEEGGATCGVQARFLSVGRAPIRPEDFDGPIRLRFGLVPVIGFRIEEAKPRSLRLSVDLGPEGDRGRIVEISPLLLNRGDRFALSFELEGFPVLPTIDHRIADTRLLILRERGIERRRRGLFAFFGFAVLAQLSLALAVLGLSLVTGYEILIAYLPIAIVAALSLNYSAARRAIRLLEDPVVESRGPDSPPVSPHWHRAGRAFPFVLYAFVAALLCAITGNVIWGCLIALPVWFALLTGAAWRSHRRKNIV